MRKKNICFFIAICTLSFAFNGCYYDVEEELYPNLKSCDTTNVGYNIRIKAILDVQCNTSGCHNASDNAAGISLDTYATAKDQTNTGTVICAIRWDSGCSKMPKNKAQLPACDILAIETWKAKGFPN
jgi:hypothetical protein